MTTIVQATKQALTRFGGVGRGKGKSKDVQCASNDYPSDIQIFIRSPAGKSLVHRVEPTCLVSELKIAVKDRIGVPLGRFRLTCEGRPLEERKSIAEYNIVADTSICAILRAHDLERPGKDGLICIKFCTGEQELVEISGEETVGALRKSVSTIGEKDTLVFQGVVIRDSRSLQQCLISRGCTLLCKKAEILQKAAPAASSVSADTKQPPVEKQIIAAAEKLRKQKEKEAATAKKLQEAARKEEERRQREEERTLIARNAAIAELEAALLNGSNHLQDAVSACRRLGCSAASHEVIARAERQMEAACRAASEERRLNVEKKAAEIRARAEEKERREREEQRILAEAEKEARAKKRKEKEENEKKRWLEEQMQREADKLKQAELQNKKKEEERRKKEEVQQRKQAERRKKTLEKESKIAEQREYRAMLKAKESEKERRMEVVRHEAALQARVKQRIIAKQEASLAASLDVDAQSSFSAARSPTASLDFNVFNLHERVAVPAVRDSGVCHEPEPRVTVESYATENEGYLHVKPGTWVLVLYWQGPDEYEARGWAYGEILGESSRRGWFPQRILAPPT